MKWVDNIDLPALHPLGAQLLSLIEIFDEYTEKIFL
jgi:hypothetical protein